jgi:hypothetical protein
MWRRIALALLLCSGAGCTSFSQADSKAWFAAPGAPLLGENDAKQAPPK